MTIVTITKEWLASVVERHKAEYRNQPPYAGTGLVAVDALAHQISAGQGIRDDEGLSMETILFVLNDDGTVTCDWCERDFDPEDAVPDIDNAPVCPTCIASINDEVL